VTWFVHNCLAWHGTCQPQSWADLGELLAGISAAVGAIFAVGAGLACLGG
jgi:hypothetical protein